MRCRHILDQSNVASLTSFPAPNRCSHALFRSRERKNYNSQHAARQWGGSAGWALTGGGAPASAPACSLSSVNQNNDCAARSPRARRRAVSSRGRQSGGRLRLGGVVSVLAQELREQPLPSAAARAIRCASAPQLLFGSRALL